MRGIYCIENKIDGKKYIGKSNNIKHRLACHKSLLKLEKRDQKQTNRYLFNAVKKYGFDNFDFYVLELLPDSSEDYLKDRELFWMDFLNTTNRDFGYNLRRDSSTVTFVHEDTRQLISENNKGDKNPNFGNTWTEEQKTNMSKIKKAQYENGDYAHNQTEEWRQKISIFFINLWKDADKKLKMVEKVSQSTSKLGFRQYDREGNLLKIWNSMYDIIKAHPDYYKKTIYSVCNGYKKTYRGFRWESFKKE
jgi:group I intron endonuclease